MTRPFVVEMAAVAGVGIKVARARAKAEPAAVMIVLRLIETEQRPFTRGIGDVEIPRRDRQLCDVAHPIAESSAGRGVVDVESAVGRIVRIERHAEQSLFVPLVVISPETSRYGIAFTVVDGILMILIFPVCSTTKSRPVSPGGEQR
jgi:hypothetical protein